MSTYIYVKKILYNYFEGFGTTDESPGSSMMIEYLIRGKLIDDVFDEYTTMSDFNC